MFKILLRVFKANFLLLCVMIFLATSVGAQSPVELNPGSINPTMMTKSGFDNYFRDNNQKKNSGSDRTKETPEIRKRLENKKLDKDSTQIDSYRRSNLRQEETYGANIFQNSALNDISELSIPPPDYPIGVGDHIIVSLWGGGEYQEDYIVARDGAIFPSGLGKITVQGLTFENAQSLIRSRFNTTVPEGTNIQITLGQPRTINVNVVGEVINPGPKIVSAFSNAYNAIGLAGGISEYGNLREIMVKRNGRVIEVLDVYKYLNTGDIGRRVYLQNNDFIVVTFVDKKVLAAGQFKRPMYYQLKKNEGIKSLINYTGGFTSDAFSSGLKVIRTENERQVMHDVNATAIIRLKDLDFDLEDGDIVKAEMIKTGIINKVELSGSVVYPGLYEIRPKDHLFDVINRAGGITSSTYLPRAYIFRGAGDSTNIKSDKLEVTLTDYNVENKSSINNVELQPNDVIQLFSNSDFGEAQYVSIDGEVRKEGRVRKYGGMTLQDLIYLSGGLKPSAEFGRLEIASIVDMDSAQKGLKPTRTIVRSYTINSSLELDSIAGRVALRPYDQIHVRKNPSFSMQENIQIVGLVKYQGAYPRLDKYERLSSYIERAGGILENANLGGAMLYRKKSDYLKERILGKPKKDSAGKLTLQDENLPINNLDQPVSIDLSKALKNKNSEADIILQENDIVYIPEINPFVTVQGKVQSPLKISFDKDHSHLGYYVDKAGGFGIKPWRKRIFVTYPNGRSKQTRNFFFLHFYPKIEPGCTITVPERPEGKDFSSNIVQALTTVLPIVITYILLRK